MNKQDKHVANRAQSLWDKRDLSPLVALCASATAAKLPEIWYFGGLGYHALGDKRKAIECWRKSIQINPRYAAPIRALSYELIESDPVGAAELFYMLVALNEANADDLTALGEIRIKQDRLGEAQRLLQKALDQEETNSLALMGMATLYAHVRDRGLTLEYLKKVLKTDDIDISDLHSDPEFEFLWSDKEFEEIVAQSA